MFFKCLDCGSVILDPDLNTSQCPICGSVNFVVEEKQITGTTPRSPRPILPRKSEPESDEDDP